VISIAGLDKAAVLAALHNATCALGLGALHDLGRDMTEAEAAEYIKHHGLRFDYVCGRPIKVDISGDEFDPRLFDRDAWQGAAEKAVEALR
jgi:hypothetical protein